MRLLAIAAKVSFALVALFHQETRGLSMKKKKAVEAGGSAKKEEGGGGEAEAARCKGDCGRIARCRHGVCAPFNPRAASRHAKRSSARRPRWSGGC